MIESNLSSKILEIINSGESPYILIVRFRRILMLTGREDIIERFTMEATSGNYDNVIKTIEYFSKKVLSEHTNE